MLVTTRMSSRGQVVIPEPVRKQLGLKAGSQFVVVARDDTVVFQKVAAPAWEEFDGLLREARRQARAAGLTTADVNKAVQRARRR